jgi:hypothetical protein
MIAFDITHTDKSGRVINYEGIFKDSIEAIRDCINNYGIGKIKVVKKGNSDEKLYPTEGTV